MEIVKKLSELLTGIVIIAGVAGSIKSIFLGKINTIIWIVISCIILIIFISNPELFVSLVTNLIDFAKSIVDTAKTK